MFTAQIKGHGPFVIRYPRGRGSQVDWHCDFEEITVGKGRKLCDGKDIAILSLGPIGTEVSKAIMIAEMKSANEKFDNPDASAQGGKLSVAHYDMRFLKPIDEEILHEVGSQFKHIITVEDGVIKGGLGSAVLEFMSDNGYDVNVKRIGIPDIFVEHGKVSELYQIVGMDAESIANEILKFQVKNV